MYPDFLIIGAPKAGTTALHRALESHPSVFLSNPKEPKFYLCDERPPSQYRGPGDAHSAQEWVWSRARYEALFDSAPRGALRGESTPFYLYDRNAQVRIARELPDAKLVVVVRDPVDRAYSNWMHAWSDGLEPLDDFVSACAVEEDRIAAGWAPFWHYRRVGLYGAQLDHLFRLFKREQVHVLRYRDLVDAPVVTLDRICSFLGIETGQVASVPQENSRPFVASTDRNRRIASAIRAGAKVGAHLPPRVWRVASTPLVRALQAGAGAERPQLDIEDRRALVTYFAPDIRRLEVLTGDSYDTWLGDRGRGEFAVRRSGHGTLIGVGAHRPDELRSADPRPEASVQDRPPAREPCGARPNAR